MAVSKKLSKQEIEEQIKQIFNSNSSQKQIKKAKRLAMFKNIKLGQFKKKFCKKCLTLFTPNNCEIRIRKPLKIVKCKSCGNLGRYKMK